jgi:hypothetical protein
MGEKFVCVLSMVQISENLLNFKSFKYSWWNFHFLAPMLITHALFMHLPNLAHIFILLFLQ